MVLGMNLIVMYGFQHNGISKVISLVKSQRWI